MSEEESNPTPTAANVVLLPAPLVAEPTCPHPITNWSSAEILKAYVALLPAPSSALQRLSIKALRAENFERCKVLATLALDDSFCQALNYLSSVPSVMEQGPSSLPTLLCEASRAIAEAEAPEDGTNPLEPSDGVEPILARIDTHESERRELLRELEALNARIFEKALEGFDLGSMLEE